MLKKITLLYRQINGIGCSFKFPVKAVSWLWRVDCEPTYYGLRITYQLFKPYRKVGGATFPEFKIYGANTAITFLIISSTVLQHIQLEPQ
jgi:hypothetical protein